MVAEADRHSGGLADPRFNLAQALSFRVVHDLVAAGLQTAQFHLPDPFLAGFWREEGIVHRSVLRDRIAFRPVVAVGIKIQESPARKHLVVIQLDPLPPDVILVLGEVDFFIVRTEFGHTNLVPTTPPVPIVDAKSSPCSRQPLPARSITESSTWSPYTADSGPSSALYILIR